MESATSVPCDQMRFCNYSLIISVGYIMQSNPEGWSAVWVGKGRVTAGKYFAFWRKDPLRRRRLGERKRLGGWGERIPAGGWWCPGWESNPHGLFSLGILRPAGRYRKKWAETGRSLKQMGEPGNRLPHLGDKRDGQIVDRRGVVLGHRRPVSTILQRGKHHRIRASAGRPRLGGDGDRVGHTPEK